MLLVQEFLQNKSVGELAREHGVYCSFNKTGQLFSCNYDMIEAKDDDLLAQECRGLVLAAQDGKSFSDQVKIINGKKSYDHLVIGETRIISFPMKRFFNYGQGSAAKIDFNDPSLLILEKYDGTLIFTSKNPFTNQWIVSTRSVPEADLLMDNQLYTFRQLFEKALFETTGMTVDQLTSDLDPNFTYCFELMGLLNRIVVHYPNNRIVLLAARDLRTLQEVDPASLSLPSSIPLVKTYSYTTIQDLVDWVSTLDPSQHEGVIVRDAKFNRIKLKNAAYLAASRARDSLGSSPRNCLEIILLGKEDDLIGFLPQEIVDNLLLIKEKYRSWLEEEEETYLAVFQEASAISPNDKKTFALTINKYPLTFKSAYFSIFDGKATSVKSFIDRNRKDGTWSSSFLDKILDSI